DELVGPELEHALASAGSAGSDDVDAGPASKLHADRAYAAPGAVDQHGLAGFQVAVVEQRLPRREPGLWQRHGLDEVKSRWLWRQAANLDGHVLGRPPVAVTINEPVDLIAHRQPRGAIAKRDDDARALVGRNERPAIVPVSISPERPGELGWGKAGG